MEIKNKTQDMETNFLSKELENLVLEEKICEETKDRYVYCENKDFDIIEGAYFKFFQTLEIPFYAIWGLIPTLPLKKTIDGNISYEHLILDSKNQGVFFVLRSPIKSKNKFVKNKEWELWTNVEDKKIIYAFLSHIYRALYCYYFYYEKSMVSKTFQSSDEIVNENLQIIRKNIQEQHDIIKKY